MFERRSLKGCLVHALNERTNELELWVSGMDGELVSTSGLYILPWTGKGCYKALVAYIM
jgi:hypothetical protein